MIEPTSSTTKRASVYAQIVWGQGQVLKRAMGVRWWVPENSRMKNTRIAPMRSHIESASLTPRPKGSGAAVGDAVVVVAFKSARA